MWLWLGPLFVPDVSRLHFQNAHLFFIAYFPADLAFRGKADAPVIMALIDVFEKRALPDVTDLSKRSRSPGCRAVSATATMSRGRKKSKRLPHRIGSVGQTL